MHKHGTLCRPWHGWKRCTSARIVPIPIPVSKNAADTAWNSGNGIGEHTSPCTSQISWNLLAAKQYPATSQFSQLTLIDITYPRSALLCCSKTVLRKFAVLPLATSIFKSHEEERGEQTELAKCLHSAIFYTLKSRVRRCVRNWVFLFVCFNLCWYQISTQSRPIHKFGCRNRYQEGKNDIGASLASAQDGCTCTSTGTERWYHCDCLWRIHLKSRQTTAQSPDQEQWKTLWLSLRSRISENNLNILLQDRKNGGKIWVALHRSGSSSVLRRS